MELPFSLEAFMPTSAKILRAHPQGLRQNVCAYGWVATLNISRRLQAPGVLRTGRLGNLQSPILGFGPGGDQAAPLRVLTAGGKVQLSERPRPGLIPDRSHCREAKKRPQPVFSSCLLSFQVPPGFLSG